MPSITEEAEAQVPGVRPSDRGQSQDEQLEEVLDMLHTDLSASSGGRASASASNRSDEMSGQEEIVPDDMSLDELWNRINLQKVRPQARRQEKEKVLYLRIPRQVYIHHYSQAGYRRKKTYSIGINMKI